MKALILVDIQNDFLPGGALAVGKGEEVVGVANRLMAAGGFGVVVATQDWHPADHGSFAANHGGKKVGEVVELGGMKQVLWPVHCVQGTRGAEFGPGLEVGRIDHVTRKGMDREVDSYSGFFDNRQGGHGRATDLDGYLKGKGVDAIFVMGLATDYCVKFTALDGVRLGYGVTVIEDGCRGVNLREGDAGKAVEEMRGAGVKIVESGKLKVSV